MSKFKPAVKPRATAAPLSKPAAATNQYSGYRFGAGAKVARESLAALTPERFWRAYISVRRPCIITTRSGSGSGSGSGGALPNTRFDKWTDDYLQRVAGSSSVWVEHRKSSADGYGRGLKAVMRFDALMRELMAGSERYYLTTQPLKIDSDTGQQALMAAPLNALFAARDFEYRPNTLIPGLVPSTHNLWLGNSKDGASSGLHHDFHDNLYVLIRGRKRFRLFSPNDTHRMYTVGAVKCVHPNGRIVYAGTNFRADGADADVAAASDELAAAEVEQAAAEAAVDAAGPKKSAAATAAAARLTAAEARLDQAMMRVAEIESQFGAGEDDDAAGAGDDKDDGDGGDAGGDDDDGDGDDDGGGDDDSWYEKRAAAAAPAAAKKKPVAAAATPPKSTQKAAAAATAAAAAVASADASEKPLPDNFSRVSFQLSDAERAGRFPLFAAATLCECEVNAGEMLFLPAGFFHEVSSFGETASTAAATSNKKRKAAPAAAASGGTASGVSRHMAFNYWFHPPDRLKHSDSKSSAAAAAVGADAVPPHMNPYISGYWPREWAKRGSLNATDDAGADAGASIGDDSTSDRGDGGDGSGDDGDDMGSKQSTAAAAGGGGDDDDSDDRGGAGGAAARAAAAAEADVHATHDSEEEDEGDDAALQRFLKHTKFKLSSTNKQSRGSNSGLAPATAAAAAVGASSNSGRGSVPQRKPNPPSASKKLRR